MSDLAYPDRNDDQPVVFADGAVVEREWPLDPPLPGAPGTRAFGRALNELVQEAVFGLEKRPVPVGQVGWFRGEELVGWVAGTPLYCSSENDTYTLRRYLRGMYGGKLDVVDDECGRGVRLEWSGHRIAVYHVRPGVAVAVVAVLVSELDPTRGGRGPETTGE